MLEGVNIDRIGLFPADCVVQRVSRSANCFIINKQIVQTHSLAGIPPVPISSPPGTQNGGPKRWDTWHGAKDVPQPVHGVLPHSNSGLMRRPSQQQHNRHTEESVCCSSF